MDLMYQLLPIIFLAHFLGDFVAQSSWMAENKHKNLNALLLHVFAYSFILFLILSNPFYTFSDQLSFTKIIFYVLANAILHGFIDFFTSKFSNFFWKAQQLRGFFLMIGFDQLVHQISLLCTIKLLLVS